jgi:hypothetical protein
MAYRDKEKQKEYQRQYYWNKTKLRRASGEIEVKSYYTKKTPEEVAENRSQGGKKAQETLKNKMGEKAYREMMSEKGKHGVATLRESGKPIGFQAGYAKEASEASAKARGKRSKHKKVRERYEA